jgi:hypothetical protein
MRAAFKKTDLGTVAMHWLLVGCLVLCVGTGLKIEADGPDALTPALLAGLLPADRVWLMHIAGGIGVLALAFAYPFYMRRAGLARRLAMDGARLRALLSGGAARWGAINVLLYWVLFAALGAQLVTGIMVFRGTPGAILTIHKAVNWLVIAYAVAHIAAHAALGGVAQLARIVNPSPLPVPSVNPERRRGLPRLRLAAATLMVGVAGAAAFVRSDSATRQVLTIPRVAAPGPGGLPDSAWRRARPITVPTMQGGNLGGSGAADVEIKAVHDGVRAYIAFSWPDPTRSLKHAPLVKTAAGWRLLRSSAQLDGAQRRPTIAAKTEAAQEEYAEDRLSVMLSAQARPHGPGAFHPGERPLPAKPASSSGRGLHYTTDGSEVEAWVWHAGIDRGVCDDMRIGAPASATRDQQAGGVPYKGGIRPNGPEVASRNFVVLDPDGEAVQPLRLPRDPAAVQRAIGALERDPERGDPEGARWWLAEDETTPFSAEADDALPIGNIIPSTLIDNRPTKSQNPSCRGRWEAGRWTVIASRELKASDPDHVAMANGVNMFVAVFDHTLARHTRHVRPIILELAE